MIDCSSPNPIQWLLTCEHAGNKIPSAYIPLFEGQNDLLQSHRGYDPGALKIARRLSNRFNIPLFYSTMSRLLVELNRSSRHPNLFSPVTKDLSPNEKQAILTKYYFPYHHRIERFVKTSIERGEAVLHVGVHTFTPVLNGVSRQADIGVLFDPKRSAEKEFAERWQRCLKQIDASLRIRKNYPYRGSSDGLTTVLRGNFKEHEYIGIELEVNQKYMEEPNELKKVLFYITKSIERLC